MARLSHENVAKMVRYCKESEPFSRMLVFQYPPNGTLYEHLHGKHKLSSFAMYDSIASEKALNA
jgi:hypothetical protein